MPTIYSGRNHSKVNLPFAATSKRRTSIVCGPLTSLHQVEELQELRRRGWNIYYCTSDGLIGGPSDLKLNQELALYDGRCIFDEYTDINAHGNLQDEAWVTADMVIQARRHGD